MTDTFKISFKLKNAYRTNGIIYSLKSIPLIKKFLPSSLYGSPVLKKFANIVSIIAEVIGMFIWKAIYLGLMVFLPAIYIKCAKGSIFLNMLVFLTVIGGIWNTHMFNPSKDKYYAMFLMRMDAREYVLTDYFYFLAKTIIGFLPSVILFGRLCKVPLIACFIMPFFIAAIKSCFSACALIDNKRSGKVRNENLPAAIGIVITILLIVAAYLPPFLGYAICEVGFYVIVGASIVAGIFSVKYIFDFGNYRGIYKEILTANTFEDQKTRITEQAQKNYLNKITVSTDQSSSKTGYAYFNDLFVKRHKRLLTKSAKRITLIELGILAVVVIACLIWHDISHQINEFMLNFFPYFLFVMYFLNRGKTITEAMFMNCDHSMLTYRFYRQPKVIVKLFIARLKSVVVISLVPAAVIALGLPLLLLITGGTDNPLNYVVLFISIIAMSIFFSVHNMVLYYLLQPYTINLEMKNPIYGAINTITYFICYAAIGKKAPTMVFGTAITAFCIIYVGVALLLAYRLAPKTFKLRQ